MFFLMFIFPSRVYKFRVIKLFCQPYISAEGLVKEDLIRVPEISVASSPI